MDIIKLILCILFIILGIILGLYVGFWIMFVGGIWDIVEMIQQDIATKIGILWAVLKIIFAAFFGWLTAMFFFLLAKLTAGE